MALLPLAETTLPPGALVALVVLLSANAAHAQFDVVTIGDSWASFIADGAPGNGALERIKSGNADIISVELSEIDGRR